MVRPGESREEARQRHLAEHPEHEKAEVIIFINTLDQDPPSAPPTTNATTAKEPRGPGTQSP
ncbi:MAG: hypothetical protein ABSA09_11555 [Desulfobaccales bacterium]|jgi:hypothetical protein